VLQTGKPLLLRILPDPAPEEPGAAPAGTGREGPDQAGGEAVAPAPDEGAVTVRNPCLSGGALEIFLEPHVPPPRITVVGQTPIARALADLGGRLGYHVEAVAGADVAPGPDDAAVVVASHGRDEERALGLALREGVPYVGLVASRRRGAAVAASLGLDPAQLARLHTPAGLDIGARSAAEIALSILAEIMSLRPRPAAGGAAAPPGAGDDLAGTAAEPAGEAAGVAHATHHAPAAPVLDAPTATDPICGMQVIAMEPTRNLDLGGVRVWFCGDGCRRAFAERAERGA
jgi:xanthine dehydrogenase accessory factor